MKTNQSPPEVGAGGPLPAASEALAWGAAELAQTGNPNPRRDAELLLLHILGIERAALIARPHQRLKAGQAIQFRQLITRRKRSEPIQYLTGEREFYGLRFAVNPDVLIPRPETEHLVEAAIHRIPPGKPSRVADIGTGSGAIAVAIAVARPLAQVTAVDVSAAALELAQANAASHKVAGRISFLESDLLDALTGPFDMIVSNPPYVADADRQTLAAEVKDYEPATALFAGPTGLEIYQRLIPQAAERLPEGGWLLLEIGAGQELSLRQLLIAWDHVSFADDLQGFPRVAIAQRP